MSRVNNPVLTGFHADPAMIKVGEYFIIANSTFEYYPGVELSRSKDLVNWESLPSPLSSTKYLNMAGEKAHCGIWAPCLTYSDGLFWLLYTDVKNSGAWKDTPNYLITAENIEGPWSEPIFLEASGFDPSLFHDEDGKKYYSVMQWDYRKPKGVNTPFNGILVQEYDHNKKELVGPIKNVYKGSEIATTEGPHIYKRNGYYYLMTAEGGTGYTHAVSVARSKSIWGPYETHPENPLLTSYAHDTKIMKAGHGSWVHTEDGRTFLSFLCSRPLPGTRCCNLGRETGIVEIKFENDWPYVVRENGEIERIDGVYNNSPTDTFKPFIDNQRVKKNNSKLYKFDTDKIDPDFKTLRVAADEDNYSLSKRKGFLRLTGGMSPFSHFNQRVLARRQESFFIKAETKIEYNPERFTELAGLTYRYDENNQYLLAVTHDEELGKILKIILIVEGVMEQRPIHIQLKENCPIYLGLTVKERWARFRYSYDGVIWNELRPELDAANLSDEVGRGFTGAFVGMFAVDTARYKKVADFEYFNYEEV